MEQDWGKIGECLRQEPRAYVGRDECSCRRFVEAVKAVKWRSRSGAQWRLLPAEYGAWNSVYKYKRFVRWGEAGVWERLLAALASDPDTEHGMLDATIRHDGAHDGAGASLCGGRAKNTARKRSVGVAVGDGANSTLPSLA